MLKKLWNWRKKIVIFPIRVYQRTLGKALPASCRFTPSCSRYTAEAIEKFGIIRGCFLGAYRILRCNPWGGHGHDPVPGTEIKMNGLNLKRDKE